ncbi:monofunctional chorismate mutase [Rubidibacter lacunae KORDI 51-2]|uniref:chorismate mutase n=1 Tax=Rubidibacter lacunae KORDI 51-2 TaxID=582515 RepID=U5DKY9_9CHRO|nr:chorismate mutase [Rubidibacter lacunae]ERN42351.1 monofunctional chorismate mutase [Rubidibacter lacunae KORDI 51-2]
MGWKVRAIRGATTATANTEAAMRDAILELLDTLTLRNHLDPDDIISATFTATRDLNAAFPAAIARERAQWQNVPLLDVQHMHVAGSLERCIRVLVQVNTIAPQNAIAHIYLRGASDLRPEWSLVPPR